MSAGQRDARNEEAWIRIAVMESRGLLIATTLAVSFACAALPGAPGEPDPDSRVESLVHQWFGLLAEPGAVPDPLETLLAGPAFRLSLAEAEVRSLDELRAWRAELHATHSRIEYVLGPIHVRSAGGDRYGAGFELSRRAVDAAGTPHIARSEQTWLLRNTPGGPVVETIDERRLLPYPGTGPQIVCY